MSRWHWQQLDSNLTASQVWERLFRNEEISTVLESLNSDRVSDLAHFSIVGAKPERAWTPELGQILPFLDNLELESPDAPTHLPFTGGYLGWLGYDLAWEIEQLPYLKPDRLSFPVAFWYEPRQFVVIDHRQQKLWLAAMNKADLDEMQLQLATPFDVVIKPVITRAPRFAPDRMGYCQMIRQSLEHIRLGDIFQANLSMRYETEYQGSGWQLYRQLQTINPSPFACYWRTPWGEMISASPERLIKITPPIIETRPIAGTRPNIPQDYDPLTSPKEIAEHIMLVDLERNDLGKVCRWGTVTVNELLVQEQYSHVVHLVSNVRGELSPNRSVGDVLRAVFPGGTITGCPKVRAMEIIETLEPDRRSLFYGSCGYLDMRGHLDLNILIRTLLKQNDRVWGQVGAGIVADSDPDREWEESLQKAKAQLQALGSFSV